MTIIEVRKLASRMIANTSLTLIPDDPTHNGRILGRLEVVREMLEHAATTYKGSRSSARWRNLDAQRSKVIDLSETLIARAECYTREDFAA